MTDRIISHTVLRLIGQVPTLRPLSRFVVGWLSRREITDYVKRPSGLFDDLLRMQVRRHPAKAALICGEDRLTYGELDAAADRLAARLQQKGIGKGAVVAICAANSATYVAIFIAILRTGAAVSPLSPSSTAAQLQAMLADSGARILFVDVIGKAALAPVTGDAGLEVIRFSPTSTASFVASWQAQETSGPTRVSIAPGDPFDIIYSSGTTGTPKGIIQSHAMRWPQLHLLDPPGYGPAAVAIISTPLYSNTTLISLLPALAGGGTVIVMPRFDARHFLELSEQHRVTVAMLVPVQYRRILDVPDFSRFDLSSYELKYATSAPFSAELKAEVLARWPGGLIEYYGMTEGGGTCMLVAHEHPDKLHTVGRPIPGHQMLVIGEAGDVLPPGEPGEVVGRSAVMMTCYHNQPGKTADAEWFSPDGHRYIRTGDLAVVDQDGFFTLIGRKKDVIISGGINIYPVDLEMALLGHPAVEEAAVIGVPSERWGETPVAFVTLAGTVQATGAELAAWVNLRLGKMQRLAEVRVVDELPRSPIGKVLKRELLVLYAQQPVH